MMINDDTISEVGLEHVLEDGLALAVDADSDASRKEVVLEGVLAIFDAATEGSELVGRNSLFIRADQKPACDTFEMIFKYLHSEYGESLAGRISETRDVFENLKNNVVVSEDKRVRCSEFLQSFLEALRLKRALSKPNSPLVFSSYL